MKKVAITLAYTLSLGLGILSVGKIVDHLQERRERMNEIRRYELATTLKLSELRLTSMRNKALDYGEKAVALCRHRHFDEAEIVFMLGLAEVEYAPGRELLYNAMSQCQRMRVTANNPQVEVTVAPI